MLPNIGMICIKSSSIVKIATFLIIHAAGALALPSVIVTRNMPADMNEIVEWLPKDNQTLYRIKEGEVRRLELNTSSINRSPIYMTISPCTLDLKWEIYHANAANENLKLVKNHENNDFSVYSTTVSKYDRYILQLSSAREGSAAVSARGESPKTVRLRLRARSKRRLAANWDPSPIDPHATLYCVVASHRRNYTSLCAAQHDFKINRQNKPNILDSDRRQDNTKDFNERDEMDNSLEKDFIGENLAFSLFDGNFKNFYKRKKFSRSTKVTDEDPMVTCVGDRTHHLIENLDSTKMYYISVFGIGNDRRAGSLLATGSVHPRTSSAKRLRENVPLKSELRGRKSIFYYKSSISSGSGIWLAVTNCGETVDVEVLVKGKRLKFIRNIDKHLKIYIPAPLWISSTQETSDEAIQFDSSSSEETKLRYVIKVTPSRKDISDKFNEIEVVASSKRWGVNIPELAPHDGAIVRELRPRRSCHSIDIAFLPAAHETVNAIKYCITTKEITIQSSNDQSFCTRAKQTLKAQCVSHIQRPSAKVIIHTINGLRADRKYAIQVVASIKGNGVPYNILFADTNACNKE